MVLTWSALVMLPTAIVASPISLRILSANGVWYMRPYIGFWCGTTWPGRDVDQIDAGPLEGALEREQILFRQSPGAQSVAEIRMDIGLFLRPHGAHRVEQLQRIAQPVAYRPAEFVLAQIRERRNER